MKRFLPLLLFIFTLSAFGQSNRSERHEKIKVLKVAFITEKLNLSELEAQKFWPIYNVFDDKTSKIKYQDMRKMRYELREGGKTLTDAQANNLLDRFIEAEDKLHKERVLLVKKLRQVISAKKIILLKSSEDDFNRKMLEQYKKRREQRKKNKKP